MKTLEISGKTYQVADFDSNGHPRVYEVEIYEKADRTWALLTPRPANYTEAQEKVSLLKAKGLKAKITKSGLKGQELRQLGYIK